MRRNPNIQVPVCRSDVHAGERRVSSPRKDDKPSFGNYGFGTAVAINVNRYFGFEGEIGTMIATTSDLQFGDLNSNIKAPNMLSYNGKHRRVAVDRSRRRPLRHHRHRRADDVRASGARGSQTTRRSSPETSAAASSGTRRTTAGDCVATTASE